MFIWDLRDVQMMRASNDCKGRECMRSAAQRQIWHARDTELASGTERRLITLIRTSVADDAVFEIVL